MKGGGNMVKYGDWRDDVLESGITLCNEDSRFAEPACEKHGWLGMRKKKINVWQCNYCKFRVEIEEDVYRQWLKEQLQLEALRWENHRITGYSEKRLASNASERR